MNVLTTLRDNTAFPFRNFSQLAPFAAAPLRIAITVTLAVNLVIFLPFQYAVFSRFDIVFDVLRLGLLAIIPLTWCRYMTAAIAIASGDEPGPTGSRFGRHEIAFAVAATVFHAIAALVILPAITLAANPADWIAQRNPTNAAVAGIVFAGILVRFASIMTAAAQGTSMQPMAALRGTARHFVSYTVVGLALIAAAIAIFLAAMAVWDSAGLTTRAIVRLGHPFAIQLALVIYGSFLAGLLHGLGRPLAQTEA